MLASVSLLFVNELFVPTINGTLSYSYCFETGAFVK